MLCCYGELREGYPLPVPIVSSHEKVPVPLSPLCCSANLVVSVPRRVTYRRSTGPLAYDIGTILSIASRPLTTLTKNSILSALENKYRFCRWFATPAGV